MPVRCHANAVEALRDEPRAVGGIDRDATASPAGSRPRSGIAKRRRAQRRSERRREFARQADDRHRVDPIGGDFHVEHGVVETEERNDVWLRARTSGSSCMMPSSNQSAGSANSSAEIIIPSDAIPRIVRGAIVSCGNRAPIVATAMICPAATLVAAVAIVKRTIAGDVDLRDLQPVGIGVLDELEDPPDDDAGDRRDAFRFARPGNPASPSDRRSRPHPPASRRNRAASQSERASESSLRELLEKVGIAVDEAPDVVDVVAR